MGRNQSPEARYLSSLVVAGCVTVVVAATVVAVVANGGLQVYILLYYQLLLWKSDNVNELLCKF
jgi:hypothetical protein